VAIRVAEAISLLLPSLANGPSSQGFRRCWKYAHSCTGPDGGYWTYLRLCADELARDAPVLFDPRNPLLALPFGEALTSWRTSSATGPWPVWAEPDTFGWTYSISTSGGARECARGAPKGWRELRCATILHAALRGDFLSTTPWAGAAGGRPFLASPRRLAHAD